jgi:predicted TIM-barrel fold metal-dependent hydrolase
LIDSQARIDTGRRRSAASLEAMAEGGIARAVLFPAGPDVPPSFLAEVRERHPGRFALIGQVDPLAPATPGLIEELRLRWDFAGVELCPSNPQRPWLNTPAAMGVWSRLAELDLPVSLCIASQDYNQLSDVVTTFASARIVIADLGCGPQTSPSQFLPVVLEYARYPQVSVSISGLSRLSSEPAPHRDLWPALEALYGSYGADRLLWGSGFPHLVAPCSYGAEAQLLGGLPFLNPDALARIGETNADRLWFRSPLQR